MAGAAELSTTLNPSKYVQSITRITDNTWKKRFAALVSSGDLKNPEQPIEVSTSRPNCERGECRVCQCAAASVSDLMAYITTDELSEQYANRLMGRYMALYPLFPLVPPNEPQQCIAELLQSCRRNSANISGLGTVYILPTTARNMIALFILVLGLLDAQHEPLSFLTCQMPGCTFFAAAMFMLQQLSAADSTNLAVLQGNLAYIAVSICLNRVRHTRRALELLAASRSAFFMALKRNSMVEVSDWQAWLHYSVSALESCFANTALTSEFTWPSMGACVQMINAHPIAGYALCSTKDFEKCQAELGDPAHHEQRLQLDEVRENVHVLFVIRENMLEELRWQDDEGPSDNVLHVILRYKFYFALVCTLFDVFAYFARVEQAKDRLNESEHAPAIDLLEYGVKAAERLMHIDQNLHQPFPLRYAHARWLPVWKELVFRFSFRSEHDTR